jgi:hypothetical protein
MRQAWIYINGVAYEKGTEPQRDSVHGPTVMSDLPDVVSPIDGTIIRGRTGLRDHCARHNVVPTADLKGLPLSPRWNPTDRERLEDIKKAMIKKGYWDRSNENAK